MQIEGNLFRDGIRTLVGTNGGVWASFKENLIYYSKSNEGFDFHYGNILEDNIFIIDAGIETWNPHFGGINEGTGATKIVGNVFWWNGTSPDAEGDGFFVKEAGSGTRKDNTVTFEKNIFLPNSNGPNGDNNLSCTGFTILHTSENKQIVFNRNTLYTGNGNGGINIGETQPTTAGDIISIKNNIFVGGSGGNGMKVSDLDHTVQDTFIASSVDYNAGFRIANGESYIAGSTGKGYDRFSFSGSGLLGVHDIDDVNPNFVDDARTPASWVDGTMATTLNKISVGRESTVKDLLEYIRAGFTPQNEKLNNAGDPAEGSPDIGALDF